MIYGFPIITISYQKKISSRVRLGSFQQIQRRWSRILLFQIMVGKPTLTNPLYFYIFYQTHSKYAIAKKAVAYIFSRFPIDHQKSLSFPIWDKRVPFEASRTVMVIRSHIKMRLWLLQRTTTLLFPSEGGLLIASKCIGWVRLIKSKTSSSLPRNRKNGICRQLPMFIFLNGSCFNGQSFLYKLDVFFYVDRNPLMAKDSTSLYRFLIKPQKQAKKNSSFV